MSDSATRFKVLTAGVISLILTMGIARFAYTPLLPIMQNQTALNDAAGGWLASINYLGYLLGALIASRASNLVIKDKLYRMGLIIAVLTTFGMALTDNFILWSIFRFFAGLSTAAGLLIGSGLLMNWLIRHGHRSELGIHFSGVGLGIAVVSIGVYYLSQSFNWAEQWIILGFIGLLLLIPSWHWLPRPSDLSSLPSHLKDKPPGQKFILLMQVAYFCAGFGYVVSATFIVSIIERQTVFQGQGEMTFLIIGLAAAPACIAWDYIARKTGILKALLIAYVLEVFSIIIPALTQDPNMLFFSAFLFGATFMGTVSLVLTMAGRFYPSKPSILMGRLTISFGLAQVIAPTISGQFAQITGNYNVGLYMAAGLMIMGSFIIAYLIKSKMEDV